MNSIAAGPAGPRPAGPPAPTAGAPGQLNGLISGTSADGIDAALVRFDATGNCELLLGRTFGWDPLLRGRLVELGQGGAMHSIEELGTLDVRIAEAFADAARRLLDAAGVASGQVRAIGSHGQTVRHRPSGARRSGCHRPVAS